MEPIKWEQLMLRAYSFLCPKLLYASILKDIYELKRKNERDAVRIMFCTATILKFYREGCWGGGGGWVVERKKKIHEYPLCKFTMAKRAAAVSPAPAPLTS